MKIAYLRMDAGAAGSAEPASSRLDALIVAPTAQATPSFFCRLVDEVVYWNTSRLSG